jgi:hypothetical protein
LGDEQGGGAVILPLTRFHCVGVWTSAGLPVMYIPNRPMILNSDPRKILLAPNQFLVFANEVQLRGENITTTDYKSFGNVARLKYLGTTLTFKIELTKKLKAVQIRGLPAIIRAKFFCLAVCCLKI